MNRSIPKLQIKLVLIIKIIHPVIIKLYDQICDLILWVTLFSSEADAPASSNFFTTSK